MDRTGANLWKAIAGINQILRMAAAAAVQVPIGEESEFKGVVDLIRTKALYNERHRG
jgi:elongation factor G